MEVGDKVINTLPMMGNEIGTIGYVFEIYELDGHGVQIIFENGEYCGFSEDEQESMLRLVTHVPQYENYLFHNVMQVCKDYRNGYWAF